MLFLALQSIICFFLGAVFGNICTTLFFRIPRNIPINGIERPPMCSSCGIRIKYPYYAPFFQFLLKGLKCFSCGAKIPLIYTLIEFFAGIFCTLFFFLNEINGYAIVNFLATLILFLSFLLFNKEGKFFDKTNWILLILAIIKAIYEMPLWEDIISFLVIYRISFGLLVALVFSVLSKEKIIQEICFFIILGILMPYIDLLISFAISILILLFWKKSKGFFILPFLLFSLI
jgi:hypothetical protein